LDKTCYSEAEVVFKQPQAFKANVSAVERAATLKLILHKG